MLDPFLNYFLHERGQAEGSHRAPSMRWGAAHWNDKASRHFHLWLMPSAAAEGDDYLFFPFQEMELQDSHAWAALTRSFSAKKNMKNPLSGTYTELFSTLPPQATAVWGIPADTSSLQYELWYITTIKGPTTGMMQLCCKSLLIRPCSLLCREHGNNQGSVLPNTSLAPFSSSKCKSKSWASPTKYFWPAHGLTVFPVMSLKAVLSQGPASKLLNTRICQ